MPIISNARRMALLLLLSALCAGCSSNDQSAAASEQKRQNRQPATTASRPDHALSDYQQQLDKAKAVQNQLNQHDQQRRQAMEDAEGSASKQSGTQKQNP